MRKFIKLLLGAAIVFPVTVNTRFVNQTIRVQHFPAGGRGAHHEQLDLILKSAEETKESGSMNPGVIFAQKASEEAQ
jgi:3-deoxy-D-manno-octulosonate 8-phosphate phosphatase KdsC-like HAD superfamily phosphatase